MRALIIFIKNPDLGKVKTRLAQDIGDQKALAIYKDLLAHTKNVSLKTLADKVFVFHFPTLINHNLWNKNIFENRVQAEGDLGAKMSDAINQVILDGYQEVCLIGSDCFEITEAHINNAFESLAESDVVIGPAKDGGYYLLGQKKIHCQIFDKMPWSKSNLLNKTQMVLTVNGISYKLLEVLSDIDYINDLPKDYRF
ncbi:MAG: TIGR04282 family arsenosugar biosynthesis glycosyltransferase [Flavobacteriales bacterium]|nr:TIGR04282 family arsenosugar biosynthesis glycosyltransferase [Flavobacteriales bacterium]